MKKRADPPTGCRSGFAAASADVESATVAATATEGAQTIHSESGSRLTASRRRAYCLVIYWIKSFDEESA
jgi:hypothetical protein